MDAVTNDVVVIKLIYGHPYCSVMTGITGSCAGNMKAVFTNCSQSIMTNHTPHLYTAMIHGNIFDEPNGCMTSVAWRTGGYVIGRMARRGNIIMAVVTTCRRQGFKKTAEVAIRTIKLNMIAGNGKAGSQMVEDFFPVGARCQVFIYRVVCHHDRGSQSQ
jgi:hypothetical protein